MRTRIIRKRKTESAAQTKRKIAITKTNRIKKIRGNGSSVNFTEKIQRQAYWLFIKRGKEHGHDQEDWAEAERLVKIGK